MNECCNYQYEHQNKFLPHRPKGNKVFSGLHMAPMVRRIKRWFSLRLCLATCLALKFPALGSYLSKMRFRADWCAFRNKSMFDEPWAERRKRGLFTLRVFNAITEHTFKWRLICKSSNLCEEADTHPQSTLHLKKSQMTAEGSEMRVKAFTVLCHFRAHYVISPKWPVVGIDGQMKGDTPRTLWLYTWEHSITYLTLTAAVMSHAVREKHI